MSFAIFVQKCVLYCLVIFYTSLATIHILITFLKNPRKFVTQKDRTRQPEVLKKGWNHAFVSLSKIKIHYVHDGNPDGPLMLFVHGFPEFWYSWRHQLKEFKKDYHVVAIDLRGYGDSEKPAGKSEYSIQNLVKDIKEIIEGLGYSSCILVSHDWGGVISWRFTALYPEMVEKLIVCNAPHSKAFQIHTRNNPNQLRKSWYMFFFQTPYLPELSFSSQDFLAIENAFTKPPSGCRNPKAMTPEDIEAFKYNFSKPGSLVSAINFYRANLFGEMGTTHFTRIKPPVLIIWGTEDTALDKGMAKLSQDQCENGRVELVENASHWVQQDQPSVVNGHIRKFLQS